ncbi:hypothetical protein B0H17DRAFT_1188022 [Mycena rosella]|uniref:Uncharacterized protein n=1 Tax=Mycena rosella TaxID=1033263 RepID=A0AAD7BP10_MYCRO|nr:hypothetical protein B0H17DRAFT_1188022 [Mycena rosella]
MRAAATKSPFHSVADPRCTRILEPRTLFSPSGCDCHWVISLACSGHPPGRLLARRALRLPPTIHKNVLDSDQAAILAVHKIGVNPVRFGNCVLVDNITDGRRSSRLRSRTQSIIPKIMDEHRSEFYLMDSATYVTSIIFCTALSKYDQVTKSCELGCRTTSRRSHILHGTERVRPGAAQGAGSGACISLPFTPPTRRSQNHMKEALVLFDSVINLHVHLLFLNKMDVFKTKLLKIPLLPRCPCSYITVRASKTSTSCHRSVTTAERVPSLHPPDPRRGVGVPLA